MGGFIWRGEREMAKKSRKFSRNRLETRFRAENVSGLEKCFPKAADMSSLASMHVSGYLMMAIFYNFLFFFFG